MKYIYYKDSKGNFGDDLNAWLWPKFFGNDLDDKTSFLGIGTILFNENKLFENLKNTRKIVFGTGIRPMHDVFKLDNTWDFKFLRGPLSAKHFNDQFEYIADAAYALRLVHGFEELVNTPKKYEISFIPYFQSVKYFDWKKICDTLGIHYISPLSDNDIEFTLKEIAASKYIISEAMHGAIIADMLRVPWNRFVFSTPHNEGGMVSEFKWLDWLYSINVNSINSTKVKLYRKSFINPLISKASFNALNVEFMLNGLVKNDVLDKLSKVSDYYLSNDNIIKTIDERIYEKITDLKKELLVK